MKIQTYGTKSAFLKLGNFLSGIFRIRKGFLPWNMDSCLQKDLKMKKLLV